MCSYILVGTVRRNPADMDEMQLTYLDAYICV